MNYISVCRLRFSEKFEYFFNNTANIDTIADNIAGNNADNKVDISDSDIYNIERS